MEWSLPKTVKIGDEEYKIRNDCDYRVILDVVCALVDEELTEKERAIVAMKIFYDDGEYERITDYQSAIDELIKIIRCGEKNIEGEEPKPKLADWEQDFVNIAPPVSRVLGYSVRDQKNYTHWYDFVGAYMEIGDCYFAQIVSIRSKRAKGKKLDESDRAFYKEHKKDIDFDVKLSREDQEWLDSDW